jgi:hypothetical protein
MRFRYLFLRRPRGDVRNPAKWRKPAGAVFSGRFQETPAAPHHAEHLGNPKLLLAVRSSKDGVKSHHDTPADVLLRLGWNLRRKLRVTLRDKVHMPT